jgi:hypothetical protein
VGAAHKGGANVLLRRWRRSGGRRRRGLGRRRCGIGIRTERNGWAAAGIGPGTRIGPRRRSGRRKRRWHRRVGTRRRPAQGTVKKLDNGLVFSAEFRVIHRFQEQILTLLVALRSVEFLGKGLHTLCSLRRQGGQHPLQRRLSDHLQATGAFRELLRGGWRCRRWHRSWRWWRRRKLDLGEPLPLCLALHSGGLNEFQCPRIIKGKRAHPSPVALRSERD